jgi:hypothetical protein
MNVGMLGEPVNGSWVFSSHPLWDVMTLLFTMLVCFRREMNTWRSVPRSDNAYIPTAQGVSEFRGSTLESWALGVLIGYWSDVAHSFTVDDEE